MFKHIEQYDKGKADKMVKKVSTSTSTLAEFIIYYLLLIKLH